MPAKKVLIFAPYGAWTVHHQVDAVVGAALRLRGCEVKTLLCDALFERCFIGGKPPTPDVCRNCSESGKKLFASLQIPAEPIRAWLQAGDLDIAQKWADGLARAEIPTAQFEGRPLFEWIATSLHLYFLTAELQLQNPDVERMCRQQLRNGALIYLALQRVLEAYKPDHVFSYNSVHSYYRIPFEMARERGLPVFVHERGMVDGTFQLYENENETSYEKRLALWQQWSHRPLTGRECEEVRSYCEDREIGRNMNFGSFYGFKTEAQQVRRLLRLPDHARIVTLFTSAGREVGNVRRMIRYAFPTQEEWIRRAAELVVPRGYTLVIRHHPNNVRKTVVDYSFIQSMLKLNQELGDKVRVIMPHEQITSYSLLWNSSLALTYFSTLGAEAVMRGVPSIGVSDTIYRCLGVKWAASPEAFDQAVVEALDTEAKPGLPELRRAYRAAHYLFFKLSDRFNTIGIKNNYDMDIRARSFSDLAEGKDPVLDRVCDHVLRGDPLYPQPGPGPEISDAEERKFLEQEIEALNRKHFPGTAMVATPSPAPILTVILPASERGRESNSMLLQSIRRSRHREIEVLEMPFDPLSGSRDLLAAIASAARGARGTFVYLALGSVSVDESLFSASVDRLQAEGEEDLSALIWGAWLLDSQDRVTGEFLTADATPADFAAALTAVPGLNDPLLLFSLLVMRKSFLEQMCDILSFSEGDSNLELSALLYQTFFMPEEEGRVRKTQLPMVAIPSAHAPMMRLEMAGTGSPCGETTGISNQAVAAPEIPPKQVKRYLHYEEVAASVNTVQGWLVPGQEKFLFDQVNGLPEDAVILEMGCNHGRSTCAMAFACSGTRRRIFSIDTFVGNDGIMGRDQDFQEIWHSHLQRLSLESIATPLRGYTFDILPEWNRYPKVDFVFIDASHEFIDVLKDFRLVYPHVKDGGWIAFHDVEPGWPGPWRVWLEYGRHLLTDHKICSTLACGRKQAGKPFAKDPADFSFSAHWVAALQSAFPASDPLVRLLEASLRFRSLPASARETLFHAEKNLRFSAPVRTTLGNMLVKDARLDGYLHFWNALIARAEGDLSAAKEGFREAVRVSFPAPFAQVDRHWRDLGETADLRTLRAYVPVAAVEIRLTQPKAASNKTNYYGASYFEWQRGIGAFGGMANLFKFAAFVAAEDRVVDYGCGGGYLLKNLPGGIKIGVEINETARKEASLKMGIECVENISDLPDGWADVVVSNHALEHVQAPLEVLQALKTKLKPGGKAVFVVPHEGPQQAYASGDVNNHLYTWNPMTLGNLFAAAGFQVEQVEAIQHQWPPDFESLYAKIGEEEFHRACKRYAQQNGNYQIRIVASAGVQAKKNHGKDWTPARESAPSSAIPGIRNAGASDLPVALVTYNRPHHAAQVLEALRKMGARNLTILSDAPRGPQDEAGVEATRKAIAAVDWAPAEVVARTENFGLARSIRDAMDRLLVRNDCAIVLEDDCVPQPGFLEFMHRAFDRYREDERVFGVTGYSVPIPDPLLQAYPYDAYFVPRIGSWGWGTWKRAWRRLDPDLNRLWQTAQARRIDLDQGGSDIPQMVEKYLRGELKDVWTLNWVLTVYCHQGQFLYPTASLIDNIGMDGSGIHCGRTDRFQTRMAAKTPARFPEALLPDARLLSHFRSFYDLARPELAR